MIPPAKKSLGQHFLKDRSLLAFLLRAAALTKDDVVLEIGPGRGILTEALVGHVKRVIAVEKDEALALFLEEKFQAVKNLRIIRGDILKIQPASLGLHSESYKIVANIPYYLTGRLLREIFEAWPKPKRIVLMLQKEVAERIVAQPPKTTLLSLSSQYFSQPKIVRFVSRKAFQPAPRVDSAIIVFQPNPGVSKKSGEKLFSLARLGFSHPRKLLLNNLGRKYPKQKLAVAFRDLGVPLRSRPGELSCEAWRALARRLEK